MSAVAPGPRRDEGADGPRSVARRAHAVAAFALLAAACLPQAVAAATFEDLYTVTVAPEGAGASRSPPRAQTVRAAMAQLLTRVTGRREAGSYPELQGLVESAGQPQYLSSYAELAGGRARVGFNATNVTRMLESLSWPTWGSERPLTLLWIAVDYGNADRAILSSGQREPSVSDELDELMDSIEEEVRAAADERGLPITFPLLDLEDQQAISFAEIWGGFESQIEQASERYAADAVLVGRISVTQFGLDVRWNLLQGGRSQMILGSSVSEGIDWLADEYAAEYSIVGGARVAHLSILGVQSWSAYLRIRSHLESLSVLETVDLEEFSDGVLTLRVTARGDDQVLERVLTLGGVLQLSAGDFGQPYGQNLVFQLAGSAASR